MTEEQAGVKTTIKFIPYRGSIEPITKVYKTEINLYPNYIEVIQSYDYTPYLPEPDECGGKPRGATMYPKQSVAVEVAASYHQRDTSREEHPTIRILFEDWSETIHIRYEKEAYEIYNRIKLWLLND